MRILWISMAAYPCSKGKLCDKAKIPICTLRLFQPLISGQSGLEILLSSEDHFYDIFQLKV